MGEGGVPFFRKLVGLGVNWFLFFRRGILFLIINLRLI